MNVIHFGTDSEYIKITLPHSYSTEGWAQANVGAEQKLIKY